MSRAAAAPALFGALALAGCLAVAQQFEAFFSQAAEPGAPTSPQAQPTLRYYSSKTCAGGSCHSQEKPFEGIGLQPICRCNEMEFWGQQDKHKIAFSVLLDDRSKKMGALLGIKDVAADRRCVSCHGLWIEQENIARADVELTTLGGRTEEGVTCVVCHGPFKEWLDKHYTRDVKDRQEWRGKSPADKEAAYGMYDLWNPIKRTQLCASCHIGDAEKDRVVTHAMLAAGHPQLPNFEIVSFSNQMPRHWQYLKEKDEAILKLLKFNKLEAELEETHLLAIGSLVVFQESLKLLHFQPEKEWPELAHFDCNACHHDLKTKSWRQDRGYAGKPGRPPLREWPAALVELGLAHAANDGVEREKLILEFSARLKALHQALDAQPFGDAAEVRLKAGELQKWIDTSLEKIRRRVTMEEFHGGYSTRASAELLTALLEMPNRLGPAGQRPAAPDFDSARQLAWAYQVLYLEIKSNHNPKERDRLKTEMAARADWKGLNDYLGLTLPPGQTKLEPFFAGNLERVGRYEPSEYFQRLNAVLKQAKGP